MSGSNLLIVFTGSIAGYKACEAVSQLVQRGHAVRVVATAAALRFVGAATLEGLTGRPVLSDLFAPGPGGPTSLSSARPRPTRSTASPPGWPTTCRARSFSPATRPNPFSWLRP